MSSDLTPGSGASAENKAYDIFELQTPPALAGSDADVVTAGPRTGRRRGLVLGSAFATAAACAVALVAFNSTGASAASPHLAASPSPAASPSGTPKAGDHPTPGPRTPHLDGTVTSVSGSKILIKDFDGFTRTIIVSSTTTYSDSLTATPAVGTKLAAEGTVDADGTSLDATKVSAPKDHGGPGGPGGFGGHGPGKPGTAPSGTPKPSPSASPSASPSS